MLAVELAARQPVAVLAGVHAAVLRDQVLDLVGDGAHRTRPASASADVDERPDVQAADRAVPVEAGRHAVPVEHRREPLCVLGEPCTGRPPCPRRTPAAGGCPPLRPSAGRGSTCAPSAAPPAGLGGHGPQGVVAVSVLAPQARSAGRGSPTSSASSSPVNDTNSSAAGRPPGCRRGSAYSIFCRDRSRIVLSIISTCAGSQESASSVAAIAAATMSKWPTANTVRRGLGHQVDQRPRSRPPACPPTRRRTSRGRTASRRRAGRADSRRPAARTAGKSVGDRRARWRAIEVRAAPR